jgi:hypothetical protein
MTGVVPIAHAGAKVVVWDRFEGVATCGAYRGSKGGTFVTLTSDLQNIMLVNEDMSGRIAMHEEVFNASLVIQFSLQRIAAAYHL